VMKCHFLAVFVEQEIGNGVRFHARRVADAIDVPLAILAGDGRRCGRPKRCARLSSRR